MPDKKNYAMETLLTHAGNHPEAHHGIVNPPVYHASTVLYSTVEQMERAQKDRLSGVFYSRYAHHLARGGGGPEGGGRALALPSGLAAIGACSVAAQGRRPPAHGRQRLRPGTRTLR
jgi:cystathionine beta-lyase